MKITAIGDIHGRSVWKNIIEQESDSDKIIFIGDYVDTHEDINPQVQADNFEEILEYKRENEDKVILLLGNHDYHYLPYATTNGIHYSGFQGHMVPIFQKLLANAMEEGVIKGCYIEDDIIFSHAGISKEWCIRHSISMNYEDKGKKFLESVVNDLMKEDISAFGFQMPHKMSVYPSWTGDNIWQSPLWIRPNSLHLDKVFGYKQVVGHTFVNEIKELDGIVLIDNLPNQYLNIVDGEFKPITL